MYFEVTYYSEKEVVNLSAKITEPVSQHIFLFPFRIEPWNKSNELDLSDVFTKLTRSEWEYEPFSPFASTQHYNEYGYFHDYVRTALFDKFTNNKEVRVSEQTTNTDEQLFSNRKPNFVSCLLHRQAQKGVFELWIKGETKTYTLQIDGISLRLFETGIAILAIELLNYSYTDFNDIQLINDFGRRVYPQFLGSDPGKEMEAVKRAFLADRIVMKISGIDTVEGFKLEDFLILGNDHLNIGKHITHLMGNEFTSVYKMAPVIDDRMYTICWYKGGELLSNLIMKGIKDSNPAIHEDSFESSPDWYRFIFLDGRGCYCPDEHTRRTLIAASTYRRWNQDTSGISLYGITCYSLMCLSETDFSRSHMRHQYRLMAELLLAQRSSIINFFFRISDISHAIDNNLDFDDIARGVRILHRDFIGFVNRLWFEEVTPQEQGIEMYIMAMKNMGLEKQMNELKSEIKEISEYVEMQYDKIRADAEEKKSLKMLKLTKMASYGIFFTIVLAGWGMSFDFIKSANWLNIFNFICEKPINVGLFILSILIALIGAKLAIKWAEKEGNK